MQQAYIVTGMMTDEWTLTLDEALPVKGGRVRVMVETIEAPTQPDHTQFMAALRERQRQRGSSPGRASRSMHTSKPSASTGTTERGVRRAGR